MNDGRDIWISKGRFEGFSDGVFAIAITLLVLGFQPPKLAIVSQPAMVRALIDLWPQYVVYAASFATIGIMWFNHYALFHHLRQVSYTALIANLALLLFVSFLPFPTLLLGLYGLLPALVFFYSLTFFVIALCFNVLWYVATLRHGEHGSLVGLIRTRNLWNSLGLIAYALAMGLAAVSPVASIALIVLMAVYYMLPSTVRSTLVATAAAHVGE
ncbi:MAG: TMEM175 family protein [Candidatus Eremiobacteraeota bacterium]|nr:TMEM175 family protein [Candidatus Eremiobacteraeota bacterium]